MDHLKSAIDRNQERVAAGRCKNGQLLVRRNLLDKVAAREKYNMQLLLFQINI